MRQHIWRQTSGGDAFRTLALEDQNMPVEALRTAYDENSFPEIKSLTLINCHQSPENTLPRRSFYSKANVLEGTINSLPAALFRMTSFVGSGGESHEHVVRMDDSKLIYCNSRWSEKTIEEIVGTEWFTTNNDLRFPLSMRNTRNFKKLGLGIVNPHDLTTSSSRVLGNLSNLAYSSTSYRRYSLLDAKFRQASPRFFNGLEET